MARPIRTRRSMTERMWLALPSGRRTIQNRMLVAELFDAALLEFDAERLGGLGENTPAEERYQEQLAASIKRHYCAAHGEDHTNVGAIWTVLLIQIASIVVSQLIRWWWESKENRDLLESWKQDRDAGG